MNINLFIIHIVDEYNDLPEIVPISNNSYYYRLVN